MAYASYFDTKVTELRFKCLQWTIYLHNLNNEVDFQIYEDENNCSIDFEIILRDNEGNNVGSFMVNDIHVNEELIEVVKHVINIHIYDFGVQVSNFVYSKGLDLRKTKLGVLLRKVKKEVKIIELNCR